MMNDINLKARILLPLSLALAALLAGFLLSSLHEEEEHTAQDLVQRVQAVERFYRQIIDERAEKIGVTLAFVTGNRDLTAALERGDRTVLLAIASPMFERFRKDYGITHFYFHDARRVNLLRVHQPSRYGDTINRYTALNAERDGGLSYGVELGPLGTFTLRVVMPVFNGKHLLGYVELGEDVGFLLGDIKQLFEVEGYVVLDKGYLARSRWEAGMAMLGRSADWDRFPSVVIASRTTSRLPERLRQILAADPFRAPEGSLDLPLDGRDYAGRFLPLMDAGGRRVGSIVVLNDMTARLAGTREAALSVGATALAVAVLLFGFIYLVLDRVEARLLVSRRKILKEAAARESLQAQHIAELEQQYESRREIGRALKQSEANLVRAQRMARLGSWEWNVAADCLELSEETRRILGISPSKRTAARKEFLGFAHPDDRDRVRALMEAAEGIEGVRELEHRIVLADGSVRVVHQQAQAHPDETGAAVRVSGTLHDITERKDAEQLSVRMGRLLEHSWNEIYMFDAETLRFIQVSDGACRNLGYSMDELSTMTSLDLKPEFTAARFRSLLRPLREGEEDHLSFETVHRRKDGSEYPVEVRLQLSRSETPPVYVAIIQDVSERKAHLAELEHMALYDPLTGLPNRHLLQDRLERGLHGARLEVKPLTVFLLGVDRLKEINDIMGHHNGDGVLQQVALRLRSVLGRDATLGRVSGDEFGFVLPSVALKDVPAAVDEIQKAMEAPFMVDEIPLDVEASIGVALYPEHGEDGSAILRHADVAMRLAKQGKSGFTVYDPGQDPYSLRRLRLFGELRQGINEGQLLLHYQPKVDIREGRITGVEALVRWRHPEQGLIPPAEFVPLAEQTGLIRSMSLWVLDEALRQCGEWERAGLSLQVAVNLSTRNLLDHTLPKILAERLAHWAVAPDRVILEITESALMDQPEQAVKTLEELRGMGVTLSIDDFGTGYSSLGYLQQLPVTELKIDRCFVSALKDNGGNGAIVRSVIDLGHTLGLKVTAEGVEDGETWDLLASLGCDTAQGYFMGRPLDPEALLAWIRDSRWG